MSRVISIIGGVTALGLATALSGVAAQAAPSSTGTGTRTAYIGIRGPVSVSTAPSAAAQPSAGPACPMPIPDSSFLHCYTPDQLRTFYGLAPLNSDTTDGAGQTVVLVDTYGSPTATQDLSFFAKTFHGPTPDFTQVWPLGQPDYTHPTGNGSGRSGPTAADLWANEATLDIEWAYAMAPKAHIVLLSTPPPSDAQGVQGMPTMMTAVDWAVATYPAGTTFSMSFGSDESMFPGSSVRAQFAKFDQTFQRGLARGDTFFSSSGDSGSLGWTPPHQGTPSSTPQVSYPNVSPYVTSVGGTQVQYGWTWNPVQDKPFNADGSFNPLYWQWTQGGNTEAAWNEGFADSATGGGLSTVYPAPAYQADNPEVATVVHGHRGVPDLAWNAATNGGALVYASFFPSLDGPPTWLPAGGTSASVPQVAAVTAIANQARKAAGKGPIGDLNKAIYSASFDRSTAFRDITEQGYGTAPSGDIKNNRIWEYGATGFLTPGPVPGYPTTTGYDLTTGWGSPRVPGFIEQLVAQP